MKQKKSIYNLANFLSISRMLMAAPLIYCFENFNVSQDYVLYSIYIIIYIVLSDVLDGYFYILLFIRDMLLVSISLYNIVMKNHVGQANVSGKLFIFLSSIMIILFIYDINITAAYVFYFLSMCVMIYSTCIYIREFREIRE